MSIIPWRKFARRWLARRGYRITHAPEGVGGNPFFDMRSLVTSDRMVVLDVGANVGQSVERFRSWFPEATVHSFEPSPSTFSELTRNTARYPNVHRWNCALGARQAELELRENTLSEWSSFLPPGSTGWGEVVRTTTVPVTTVDEFCRQNSIEKIDVLKSDTQGYDLEVFKGAGEMFSRNAVTCIYCEIIFSDLYAGVPSFGELYDFLTRSGFVLVSFYDLVYENGIAAWTDGLFVNKHYLNDHPSKDTLSGPRGH